MPPRLPGSTCRGAAVALAARFAAGHVTATGRLIGAAEMRAAIEFVKDPDTHDLGYTLISAWGRKAALA